MEEVPKKKKEKVTPKGELISKPVAKSDKDVTSFEKTLIARHPPPFP